MGGKAEREVMERGEREVERGKRDQDWRGKREGREKAKGERRGYLEKKAIEQVSGDFLDDMRVSCLFPYLAKCEKKK